MESLLSEKEGEESLTVCDTEKLSSNFLMKDLRKDYDPTECSCSSLSLSFSEFYLELSLFIDVGKRRSFELEEFSIFRKSDFRLIKFLVER